MNADHAAEQAVLGAVIESAGRIYDRLELTGEDFHAPQHQELWEAVGSLLAVGKPLDATVLMAHLGKRAASLGMVVADCVRAACVPHTAFWHARALQSYTARRRVEAAAATLAQLAASEGEFTPEELAEMARGAVDQQMVRAGGGGEVVGFGEAVLAGIDRWSTPDTNVLGTGWYELDETMNGGLRPGHLVIVGARPGVGKSLVATELSRYVAAGGAGVLFSSLEMRRAEVVNRIMASMTKVPLATLTAQTATAEQMDQLSAVLPRVADWPLVIDDRASVGLPAIRGRARDMTRRPGGLGLVIVDYLQLVTPPDRSAPREQQVASLSRGLKLLARDLDVPVVALAQLNRGSTQRANTKPQLHDLRESGSIEADADEVWLLHRDEDGEHYGELEINVAKNRHGQVGSVYLGWQAHAGRIVNLSRQAA